jgi:D-alanyl-D-alanine carboxypeptidase
MKTTKFPSVFFMLSVFVLPFLVSSCEKEKGPEDICILRFDAQKMADNIHMTYEGNVMGYSFIVMEKGVIRSSGAEGDAQTIANNDIDMSLNLEMHVASISKFMTTVLALRACTEKGISINSTIGQFLPADWSRGNGINMVTIAQLCNHTAGLDNPGPNGAANTSSWDSLQLMVAAGANQPKSRLYRNTHHGLLRVILPKLYYDFDYNSGAYSTDMVDALYRDMMHELVLDPLDIKADLKPSNRSQILGYNGPDDTGAGVGTSWDFTDQAGGFGWHLSTIELAKLWSYAWYSDELLTKSQKDWLKSTRAGLWNTLFNQKHGTYYCKLGGWNNGGRWVASAVMLFPDDIQVVMFINSPVPDASGLASSLAELYDESFGCF